MFSRGSTFPPPLASIPECKSFPLSFLFPLAFARLAAEDIIARDVIAEATILAASIAWKRIA